jgi:hypothetical protein
MHCLHSLTTKVTSAIKQQVIWSGLATIVLFSYRLYLQVVLLYQRLANKTRIFLNEPVRPYRFTEGKKKTEPVIPISTLA